MNATSFTLSTGLLGLLALQGAASAQLATGPADLQTWLRTEPNAQFAVATIDGAEGNLFALFASLPGFDGFDFANSFFVGAAALDAAGDGRLEMAIDATRFPAGYTVDLCAVYKGSTGLLQTEPSTMLLTVGDNCENLDFDQTIGQVEPATGQIIDNEWSLAGLNISAENAAPGHPDLAIIFDGANPTGGDTDLTAPSLGKLLIIAENAADGDGDGLVDDPDDEAMGGTISFAYDDPVTICSLTVIDIDTTEVGGTLQFTHSDASTTFIQLDPLGDGLIQTLDFVESDVTRMDVNFVGSGAVGLVRFIPCPYVVNFDERTLGTPLDLETGEWITNQFADIGMTVSAFNNNASHPSKAILFDSEHPTGGDFDLQTPGYGLNNDTPLGKVLILAENDVDGDGNGLVDNPDDEENGGQIVFDFTTDVAFYGAVVMDVDGTEFDFFEGFDAMGNSLGTVAIQNLGDNSVQTLDVDPPLSGVRKVVLNLGGSGAITRLRFCPDAPSAN